MAQPPPQLPPTANLRVAAFIACPLCKIQSDAFRLRVARVAGGGTAGDGIGLGAELPDTEFGSGKEISVPLLNPAPVLGFSVTT
eukprot:CAMPEP_0203655482 /NCGR_PEP_ID=MMETSP0088-20131115/38444_1 /ASSEMBLY_ACC=CAM_ASM_001087 /TAXON_ID=426623 /ORGANISM="Chaetoceros affinis, Strain CCMP159" /LENGTH=83 /DNA_ID=CAMNT_0050516101 /DNA_START=38 /DNA_END=290 /DNA_ORIENTATION=+